MELRKWLALFVLALVFISVESSQTRRHKIRKHRERQNQIKVEEVLEESDYPPEEDTVQTESCSKKRCGAGKECKINENGLAECDCVKHCQSETEPRRMVCSNYNETWSSDCELHRMRCLCKKRSPECDDEIHDHVHIEYYGPCQKLPECTPEQMVDFPRRMRDWLFNVMRDMADRKELSPHYENMEREAEKDRTRKWANAAIWKFCDLDGNPPDRKVSRHELFPIRAPLVALEQCVGPFLDTCDRNNDHFITLKEWGKCLELDETELEGKCETVRG